MKNYGLLLAISLFSISISTTAFSAKGVIFKSCGGCINTEWHGYQQVHTKTCEVIGWEGAEQTMDWTCDPDATPECNTSELKLLNQVSRGQVSCAVARAKFAKQSCGELGYPDCALFSK